MFESGSNNLCDLGYGQHYYTLTLFDLCPGSERKELKNYCIYIHKNTRTPEPGLMKFTILIDPPLVIFNIFLIHVQEKILTVLKKYKFLITIPDYLIIRL